jgi:glycosyltransferase involved in cell wall biosynthesis
MKVLIFTTQFYKLGGYERLSIELAQDINHFGIRTDILSQYTNDLPGVPEAEERIKSFGIPQVLYLNLSVKPNFVSMLKSIFRLRKLLIINKYDVVETSGFTPTLITLLSLWNLKIKHVVGIHDEFTKQTHTGFRYFLFRNWLRCRSNTVIYTISLYVKDKWIEYFGVSKLSTKILYNAINEEYFNIKSERLNFEKELGAVDNPKIILFVGRLLKRKGIDTAFDAVLPLISQLNIHMVLIGSEDDTDNVYKDENKILPRIRNIIKNNSLDSRVHFLGFRNDIPRIMASSDILIHPARIEGFGLVLAEALAVGLPVVASNVGGIPEVLQETESILVPPENTEELSKAINVVLNWSPEKRLKAIQLGKQKAKKFRSINRAKYFLKLLE